MNKRVQTLRKKWAKLPTGQCKMQTADCMTVDHCFEGYTSIHTHLCGEDNSPQSVLILH